MFFFSHSSCDIEIVRNVRDKAKAKDKYNNKQQEESLLNSKQNHNNYNHNQNVNYTSKQHQNQNLSSSLATLTAEQQKNENVDVDLLHLNHRHQLTPHAVHRESSTDDSNVITASFDNCNRKFDDLTNSDCKNNNNINSSSSNYSAYSSIPANPIDVDFDLVDDELGTEHEHILHLSNATTTGEDNSPNRQIVVRRIRKVRKTTPLTATATASLPTTTSAKVPPKKGSFYDILVLCIKYILILLTRKLSTFKKTKDTIDSKSAAKMGFLRSMKLKERIVMSFAASLVLFTLFLVIDVQMDFGMTSKHLLPSSSHDKVRYVQNEDSAGFMRDFKRKFLQKR